MVNATVVTEHTTNSSEAFDSKINNWAEGILLTIDADGSRLTIRGAMRPYASEYAKMLKKIHDKTEKMTQVERLKQALEIRLDWTAALQAAETQKAAADHDMNFQLPGKDGRLVIVDETPFYKRETQAMPAVKQFGNLTDKECKAISELKDLKVGDCVVIGYASGLLRNDVYAVIKANTCLSK